MNQNVRDEKSGQAMFQNILLNYIYFLIISRRALQERINWRVSQPLQSHPQHSKDHDRGRF